MQDDFFKSTTMWAAYKGICDYFGVTPTYDYYSCDLVSSDIPAKIVAGQTVPVHVTFRNHGVVWSAARGFRLDALVTPDPFTGQTLQPIVGEVSPNDTITFTFDLTAPTALGAYQTGWMMARDGYTALGHRCSRLCRSWMCPTMRPRLLFQPILRRPRSASTESIYPGPHLWTTSP